VYVEKDWTSLYRPAADSLEEEANTAQREKR